MNFSNNFSQTHNFSLQELLSAIKNGSVSVQNFIDESSDFQFELNEGIVDVVEFLESSWHVAFLIGVAYVGGIFYLQSFMRNRKPIELKKTLFVWNILIGIFSLIGFARTAPQLLSIIRRPGGYYESICLP